MCVCVCGCRNTEGARLDTTEDTNVFFPMKINSLHWNVAVHTCKEKSWQKVAGGYQML